MALDRTDRKILAALGRDARISYAALGREINLSRTAVQDRVSRLEKDGVIRGYRAEISDAPAGLIQALLFVGIAARPCEPALQWLASLEGVCEVFSLTGDVDAVARCIVASPEALAALNDRVMSSDMISASTSHVILGRR
jgi:DNA-binding Lrp family transcriptional regulator